MVRKMHMHLQVKEDGKGNIFRETSASGGILLAKMRLILHLHQGQGRLLILYFSFQGHAYDAFLQQHLAWKN
jgi:hypothetical protein